VLNPDGSSDFVKGDKRFLDAWFEDRRKEWVGKTVPLRDIAELDCAERYHMKEVAAVEDRSNPWRELKEFEEKYERKVPIEAKVYESGITFEQDVAHYHVGDGRVRYFSGELMGPDVQGPWRGMGRRYHYGPETVVYKMARGLPV